MDATYKSDLRDLIEVQAQRFDARLEQRLAETRADLRGEMQAGFAQSRAELANLRAELIKWMFLFWLGTVGVTLASVLAR